MVDQVHTLSPRSRAFSYVCEASLFTLPNSGVLSRF